MSDTGPTLPSSLLSSRTTPGGPSSSPYPTAPIIPKLPERRKRLINKYDNLGPAFNRLPQPIAASVINLDSTRVARGQNPLTGPETVQAIGAAVRGEPITPAPEEKSGILDVFGNFAADVGAIGASLPHLPMAIAQEFTQLGDFGDIAKEQGILNAPIVRQLPGAYTFQALLDGGPGAVATQAAQHPGFTALDLLPYAAGARKLPVGGGRNLGNVVSEGPVGRAAVGAREALGVTRPGMWARTAFGNQARDVAGELSSQNRLLQEAAQGAPDDIAPMAGTIYEGEAAVPVARRTSAARTEFSTIPPERQAALMDLAEGRTGNWRDELDSLPPEEQAYLQFADRTSRELAAIGEAEGLISEFKGEWYDTPTGRRLEKGQAEVTYARNMATVREAIISPASDPSGLVDIARSAAASDTLSAARKAEVLRGVSHGLDVAGYDGAQVRSTLRLTDPRNPSLTTPEDVIATMDDVLAAGPTAGTITPAQAVDWLKPYRSEGANVRLAINNIQTGNLSRARENIQAALRTKSLSSRARADLSVLPDQLSEIGKQQKFLSRTEAMYNPRTVTRLERQFGRQEARTVPARFAPSVQERVREGLLEKRATDPNFDQIEAMIERGQYSADPTLAQQAKELTGQMRSTWREMKAEGHDPIFIHHVSPGAGNASLFPKITIGANTPSWARARTMDATPYAKNMSVALDHQALELLSRRGSEAFADNMTEMFGRTRFRLPPDTIPTGPRALVDQQMPGLDEVYRTKAQAMAEVNPTLDINGRVDQLIKREWTQFDPNSFTPWRKGAASQFSGGEQIFLPKPVADVIEQTFNPKTYAIQGLMDPVMKVFRTSVLALAPRWHFNNIIGGAVMVAAEDPRMLLRLGRARKMMRGAEVTMRDGTTLTRNELQRRGAIGGGFGSQPREVLEWDATGRLPSSRRSAQLLHSYMSGRTMRRLMDRGGKIIKGSYELNGFVDDMYRSAAYLTAYDRAVKSGSKVARLTADEAADLGASSRTLTREAAETAGMEMANKVFQNWDRMTPIERNVMRYVFPFYGWVSHVTKYVLRYPMDHPLRSAVIGSFGRHELEDLRDSGLPDSFLNMFFLGNTDDQGNQKAVSLGAINPFSSVGDSFTLAGLTGNLNPVMGAFLTKLGIDPLSGEAELYPDLEYDPETGRMGVKTTGLVQSLANTLPQVSGLLTLVGQNAKFNELQRTNPDSALNMLRSQGGFPVLFRNLPLVQTQMKSELARDDAQEKAFNEALRSGGYAGLVKRYPTLDPAIRRLGEMDQAGQLDAFRFDAAGETAGAGASVFESLVRRNLPTSDVPLLAEAYEVQNEDLQRFMPWQTPTAIPQ